MKFKTREFNQCTGDWFPWSNEYIIDQHTLLSGLNGYDPAPTGAIANDRTVAVIAPFAAGKNFSATLIDSSALLGWNIVWVTPDAGTRSAPPYGNSVHSRMWLRTNQSLTSNPTLALLNNEWWGTYPDPNHTGLGLQPINTATPTFNVLFNGATNFAHPYSFPTITNTESKKKDAPQNYTFDIAFSTDGTGFGIKAMNETCFKDATGHSVGQLSTLTIPIDIGFALPKGVGYVGYVYERNPSITVNSSGQSFVAWERTYLSFIIPFVQWQWFSEICENHKIFNKTLWNPSTVNPSAQWIVREQTTNTNFEWFLNPSISGYPKSRWQDEKYPPTIIPDQDPAAVDLYFWQKKNNTGTVVNNLKALHYCEPEGSQTGNGQWYINVPTNPVTGANSQTAIGMYNPGPKVQTGFVPPEDNSTTNLLVGNAIGGGGSILNGFALASGQAYKGTYDTVQDFDVYRGEAAAVDSSLAEFVWGRVYVGDTLTSLPMRQVIMHWGVDSTCDSNVTATRDSAFRTEVFDLPVGANITYWRSMFFRDSLSPTPYGNFYGAGKAISYTVELVSETGTILDTIETLIFSPYYNKFIYPKNVTITNSASALRNVFLRVRGSISIGTSQQLASTIEGIFAQGVLASSGDTGFTIYKRGYPAVTNSFGLTVYNPYPNPVTGGIEKLHIPFTFAEGYPVKFQVYDALGREYSSELITANGSWQECTMNIPVVSGVYLVKITAAGQQKTLPFTISK